MAKEIGAPNGGTPSGYTDKQVASDLKSPTALAIAPDGRVFVAEQAGRILIIRNDTLLPRPFVVLTVNSESQRGVLGIVLDPSFSKNGHVYVYYTTPTTAHARVSRFRVDGDTASAEGETVLLDLPPRDGWEGDHMGGGLAFGQDGKLYVGVGDHQLFGSSQNLGVPFGKILRMNTDGTFPEDNPYRASGADTGWEGAVWSYGMRNPFGLASDPETGFIYAADVGEATWEEIDLIGRGKNYGWHDHEGPSGDSAAESPIHAYGRDLGCSVIGGDFSPSKGAGVAWKKGYYFADFCGGWIRRLEPLTGVVDVVATGVSWPASLRFSSDGSLYYAAYFDGAVYKIAHASP